jgi:excisionase family DNA binding protein
MNINMTRKAWGLSEVAESIGVSQGFLRKQIRSGQLHATRVGRRVLIKDEEFQRYLDQGSQQPKVVEAACGR